MEKKKALSYKKFLIEAQQAFVYMMEQKSAIPPAELKRLKRRFSVESFEYAYSEFEEEIFENYKNYGDLSVIYSFLKTTFPELLRWDKPDNVILDNIMKAGFEDEFLLKLHLNTNSHIDFINSIADSTNKLSFNTIVSKENFCTC